LDNQTQDVRHIFFDIEDLNNGPGQKVINALLASKAVMFRTKRGRLALSLRLDIFEKLRKQLRLELTEGLDGLRKLEIGPPRPAGREQMPS
jgi:hypothetical protein